MDKELHLFIIWNKARFMEKQILNDLKKKFEILQTYEISWSEEHFAENLSRFYGKKLPKSCKKEKEIGIGPFLVVLVYDNHPKIINNQNRNIITTKQSYRQLLGKNLIHASDNAQETAENILFIFGKNVQEIINSNEQPIYQSIASDISGCPAWNTITEALEIAQKVPFTKIEAYKDAYLIHSRNADLVRRILNASPCRFKIPGRHKYYVKVGKTKQAVYIRKVH